MKRPENKKGSLSGSLCVIYARFSSAGQREESIEGQVRECKAYAKRLGMKVGEVYADRALSGTSDARPAFQKMIKDAEAGAFDVIVCWKHDRFARSRYDAAVYKNRLKHAGVRLEYVMEPMVEGAQGVLIDSVLEGFAEYYSANLSENVKRGLYESALKRWTLGQICFGLREAPDKTWEIDPETGPVVREIFERYAAGEQSAAIARDLNERGFRTRIGRPFVVSSIYNIIKNPKYKGLYVYEDIEDPEGIPAIVSPELWEKANMNKDERKRAPNSRRLPGQNFILSGKLFCGECGAPMTAGGGRSKSGAYYDYYVCNNRRRGGSCRKEYAKKQWIEDLVVDLLVDSVLSDEMLEWLVDQFMKHQVARIEGSDVPRLRAELADVEKRRSTLLKNMQAVELDVRTMSDLSASLSELGDRASQLEDAIAREEEMVKPFDRATVDAWLRMFRDGDVNDPMWRRSLVNVFLRAVWLFDDRVVLDLNYTGEEEGCVTFEIARDAAGRLDSGGADVLNLSPLVCQTSRTLKARVFTFLSGRALMVAKVPPSRLSLS